MQIDTNPTMEVSCLILLLCASGCIALYDRQIRYQRTNDGLSNLERWQGIMKPSNTKTYYQDIPQENYDDDGSRSSPKITYETNDMNWEDFLPDRELELSFPEDGYEVRDLSGGQRHHQQQIVQGIAFQSMCPTIHRMRPFNETGFIFRPENYVEIRCLRAYPYAGENSADENRVCDQHHYSCVEVRKRIFVTRKRIGTDCWESVERIVFSGCECMWPKDRLGDIVHAHL